MDLNDIGKKHGTDKSSETHDYLAFYERIFERFRDQEVKILEIGVLDGASLKTWEEYFPRGTIIGADIQPATKRFEGGRVSMEILDQSNVDDLHALGLKHGPFDIIIEDGSHHWEHQITSLRSLFPFLRAGGYYVVEDLQTNYGAMQANYRGIATISCMEYLKKAVDLRVAGTQTDITKEEDGFLRTYARSMNLSFYQHSCIIEKMARKIAPPPLSPSDEPLLEIADEREPVRIAVTAHFGIAGDVTGRRGALKALNPISNIQGFSLQVPEDMKFSLRYRARLSNGMWTEWAISGMYVGTRGAARDITGFAVRLDGDLQHQATLRVAGAFRGEEEILQAGAGEDCTRKSGLAPLYGLQVMLVHND